ncbi:MAG: ATP-binding cassette domain-containing protein [Clostridia bacterium]
MINVNDVTLRFGKRVLFEDVNIKFAPGNCYGLIGANGAGKTTFLKVISGEIEPSKGDVTMNPKERLSVLKQDHFAYDSFKVIDTVIIGNTRLHDIMNQKMELYCKEDFNDNDGIKLGNLEAEFEELNGWMAESDAASLLLGLGIEVELHEKLMSELSGSQKVKVLLAQALFGNPDNLLLDEPTNNLDLAAISWLEEFLINYENTVIVISHDRYFLNKICTHIADIDYNKIKLYSGNYDFWYESSQLASRQMKESNKKKEDKIKELQDFIARFSANASKSKQATSRKKILEKIVLDEIIPSTRKYPYIDFKAEKESGKEILKVENLCKSIDGKLVLNNLTFTILKGDKIALVGEDTKAKTALFKILMGEMEPNSGTITYGSTIKAGYIPKDNSEYFTSDRIITDWLSDYYANNDETVLRSFLGRMLFSGEEALKKVNVLSGGEKARCMLAKTMLEGPNLVFLDEPTNHLDLESITALNDGLEKTKCEIMFTSHDHQFIQTIANRIIEVTPNGKLDKRMTYDEYLDSDEVAKKRDTMY